MISRFYEQFSRSSRILGHFLKFEKFKTLGTQIYHISFWSGWSGDSKYIICFKIQFNEKFKFRGFTKAFKNFAKYIIAFIFAKFNYFAKQIIYLGSLNHPLQNDVWYVCVLRVWDFFRTSKNGLNSYYFAKIAHKIAKSKYFPNILNDSDSRINSLSDDV